MYAVDFGTGGNLAIHGPTGPVSKAALKLPRNKPGEGSKTLSQEFPMILDTLMSWGHDVVVESPTVGSSGVEPADVEAVLRKHSGCALFTLSARVVKNYRLDHGLAVPEKPNESHGQAAEILYIVATVQQERLRVWHHSEPAQRIHTSVRPMDKRGYRDARADAFMRLLPDLAILSSDLRALVASNGSYRRSLVMPFAMALTEPYWRESPFDDQRKAFEKLLGLYDHGYPSFYRRMTVEWLGELMKQQTGKKLKAEVTRAERKIAQRVLTCAIRELFHKSKSVEQRLVSEALNA